MSAVLERARTKARNADREARYRAVATAKAYRLPWIAAGWAASLFPLLPTFGYRWGLGVANGLALAAFGWTATADSERSRRARLAIALRWARACLLSNAYPAQTSGHFEPKLPRLRGIRTSHGGNVHATVVLPPGMTLDAPGTTRLDKLAPLIASHYDPGVLDLKIEPAESIRHARLTIVTWRAFDGLTETIPYAPGAGIAVLETGEPLHLTFPGPHMLVVGQTGAGKSGWLNGGLAEAVTAEHRPELWGVDLKLTELTPWEGCFDRLALDPAAAIELVYALEAEQLRRQAILAKRGLRAWEPGCGFPPLLLVVDELNQVVHSTWGDEDAKAPSIRRNKLARIAALGRATGVQCMFATQDPKAAVLDQIRPNMQTTVCGHVRAENDAVTCLGPGLAADLRPEILVPPTFWYVPAAGKAVCARARWLDDATVAEIAAARQVRP